MASSPENPPTKFKDSVKSHHKALLIFTSGTTGFPKAAVLTHERFKLSNGGCKLLGLTGDDRIYSCLPLFHTTGAGLALGNAWTNRCTLILSSRFSASKVMPHCCTYNATALVYVGEICRYLLASPPNPNCDSKHQIRKVFGNGLRKDIWLDFKHRFNIPEVIEFYGSTEGNIFMFNRQIGDEIGVGAVGRAGVILRTVAFQFEVVKYDVENDIPLRDENGRCIKVRSVRKEAPRINTLY